jgi:hypothetical protein
MKRLLLWVIILTVLFSGGIAVAGQRGIGAPKPAFAQWFTYPDGKPCPMPCLFGIRPGVTKFDDVKTILETHPLMQNWDLTNKSEVTDHRWFVSRKESPFGENVGLIIQNSNVGLVKGLALYSLASIEKPITFEEVLQLFGIPQRISLSYYNNDTEADKLRYSRLYTEIGVLTHPNTCTMSPYNSLHSITINSEAMSPYTTQWAGFSRHTYWTRHYRFMEIYEDVELPCTP